MNIDQIENIDSDFYKLRKEALSWIENTSGKEWTDYNAHDPGITILEAFCYILTEIQYKTEFSIEDILYSSGIPVTEILEKNGLYPAEIIFPTFPVTISDFRMKILDKLQGVRNVWIINFKENGKQHSEIIIELTHDAEERNEKENVASFLKDNKILGWKIDKLTFLTSERFKLYGKIYIHPKADPEKTFAQLLYLFNEKLVNVNPTTYSFSNLINNNYTLEQIFEGPFMEKGFILSKDLHDYEKILNLKEIKHNLIESEWIQNITEFGISKETDSKIYYHQFEVQNELPFLSPSTNHAIQVIQENKIIELNKEEVYYQYGKITQYLKREYSLKNDTTTFSFGKEVKNRNISTFYRLLEDLPTLYKITNQNDLHSNYSVAKDLSNTQLQNFVLPFEQLLANTMKTVEALGKHFQLKTPSIHYNQQPLKNVTTKLSHASVNKIEFLTNRNKALDHLLSRFNIFFSDKIQDLFFGNFRLSLQQQIKCKEIFLQNVPNLTSSTVYSSFEYFDHVSYMELEILLRLWIPNIPKKPFYKSLSNYEITLYRLTEDNQIIENNYLDNYFDQASYLKEYLFFVKDEKPLENILKSGINKSNYTIEKVIHDHYSVCLQTGETNFKNIIYQTHHKEKAFKAVKLAVKKFYKINQLSEGFYLLDHSKILNKELNGLFMVTFIFPSWSVRFQSVTFQEKTKEIIYNCLPAHLQINFIWLDYDTMKFFEIASLIYEKSTSDEIEFSEEIVKFISNKINEQR